MRVPVPLAWLLVGMTLLTAGLLRQFHDETPRSPYVPPIVGSLLFAACLFLLLVAAREWRRGAVPGRGIRLGSLTPIMLMLLVEKWISLTLYNPLFYWLSSDGGTAQWLDARFRLFAGVGLVLVCLLVGRFSVPTARKVWRRARPARWPAAALQTLAVVAGTYFLLGALAWGLGGSLRLKWPQADRLLLGVVLGQALLALAEELYYRGLLMTEMERLAPRLGARSPVARRWTALLTTSAVFGMEHMRVTPEWGSMLRQLAFSVSLGVLLGLLITVTANLHVGAGMHAWINWLLLGAAPHFVDGAGDAALPAGTYIGVSLILAFVASYVHYRWRHPAGVGKLPVPSS